MPVAKCVSRQGVVMRIMARSALLVGVVMLLLPTASSAQMHGLGLIRGTVKDDGGNALKGVHVRATRDGAGGVIEGTSDESGAWQVNGIARGEWHLTFQIAAYVPVGAKVVVKAELVRVPPVAI